MPHSFPSQKLRRLRMESMADEDCPPDGIEIMPQGHLGRDPRSQSSLATRDPSSEEDFGWHSGEETRENNFYHFRKGSSRITIDDPSEMTSSPSRYDDSSSTPITPMSSQNAQDSQSFFHGYQGGEGPQCCLKNPQSFSSQRPVDLTDDELACIKPEFVDLTEQLDRVGETFDIDPADCMTDDQFEGWLPCSPRDRPTHDIHEAIVDGIVYRPSMSLKLLDDSYLRIETIRRQNGEYVLYGRHLLDMTDRRADDYLPRVKGELVWITKVARPVSVNEVAVHQDIRFTNERTDWQDHEDLVCRLRVTVRLRDEPPVRRRDPLNADERIVEYLSFEESDAGEGWASTDLRDCWRGPGETVPFGAADVPYDMRMQIDGPEVIDLEDTPPLRFDLTGLRDRTYTFGDAYSGAGGASYGARQAGLVNAWASDVNIHAVDTYRRNFEDTDIYHAEFFQLMTIPESELRVDIAHCSPPCQPFSPAHTVNNQTNDERNSACVFTGSDLIKRVRPRVLTMEETNGLNERFKPEFNRIILNFIQDGYSVRWSVLECSYYGVPQFRKRLMMIAAGPGETLPEFPQPTHSLPGGGLKPIETIHRAINDIPCDAANHDVEEGLRRWALLGWRRPYNGHQPARTLTCNGGESNYHPSGKRTFTCRELASLQTFPIDFQFSKSNVRKQIGNAVPPKFADAVFRQIRRSLRETDEEELQQREARWVGM
ncbi:hypothetical protein N7476_000566 [Penicillium atrosanguineum]|uniref:DNA (cytosine-5-)-methyltransferase n=1 Tax=Penicillium atrosanguineum TaxID=1132637 RepID=A0A9W9UC94_9EURO|nr:hypothetical protein N7476_000566 [Penicillium atrosanguineum]